jgi:hypothetical protein
MLFTEIVAVYSDNHKKLTNALCVYLYNSELLNECQSLFVCSLFNETFSVT